MRQGFPLGEGGKDMFLRVFCGATAAARCVSRCAVLLPFRAAWGLRLCWSLLGLLARFLGALCDLLITLLLWVFILCVLRFKAAVVVVLLAVRICTAHAAARVRRRTRTPQKNLAPPPNLV